MLLRKSLDDLQTFIFFQTFREQRNMILVMRSEKRLLQQPGETPSIDVLCLEFYIKLILLVPETKNSFIIATSKDTTRTIHKEKFNKMQQCINILSFHIFMKLTMFRVTNRPSSGTQTCTGSLWFFVYGRLFGRVVGGCCQAQYCLDV
jgi:hypothetical protein